MSHFTHRRNLQSCGYTITLIKRGKKHLVFQNWMFLHCKKLNHLYPWMICAKFAWNWPRGSGEKDFQVLTMYIPYFVIIFPWKRAWPFIWTNLNSLHPRKLCVKVGWNWPMVLEKNIFEILPMYVYLPLGGWTISFEQIRISSTQGCFIPSLAEIGTMVLEKKTEMWKVSTMTTTNNGQILIRKISDELKIFTLLHRNRVYIYMSNNLESHWFHSFNKLVKAIYNVS